MCHKVEVQAEGKMSDAVFSLNLDLSLGLFLLPHRVWIQFRNRLPTLDVFIDNSGHIRFRHLGVPGRVRINDDGRSLLAGAQAGGTADEHVTRGYALLHEADIKGHEERGCSGATAGRLRVAWGPGVGADDNVMFRL